jgi:hypothetical protein
VKRTAACQIEKSPSVKRVLTFCLSPIRLLALLLIWCSVYSGIITAQATTPIFPEAKSATRPDGQAATEDTDDLDDLYSRVLDIRTTELDRKPPNYSRAVQALDYSLRAIRLLETGATSAAINGGRVNPVTAFLYQTAAIVEARNGNHEQALKYFRKSSATDPGNGNLRTRNDLGVGKVCMEKYAKVAKQYAELPEARKTAETPDSEVTALLTEVNARADDIIEAWARFLASPKSVKYAEIRVKVEDAVRELYKFRHHESVEGLQELINSYRPK